MHLKKIIYGGEGEGLVSKPLLPWIRCALFQPPVGTVWSRSVMERLEPAGESWADSKRREAFQESRAEKTRKLAAERAAKRSKKSGSGPETPTASAQVRAPLDLLAREWLDERKAPADARAYLVEKLLPTLVVGIEKLLTEVGGRREEGMRFF